MDHHYNEVSAELLVFFSFLDLRNLFSKFDVDKIAQLTETYDQDFSTIDQYSTIRDLLETFVLHVQRIDDFVACHDLGCLP